MSFGFSGPSIELANFVARPAASLTRSAERAIAATRSVLSTVGGPVGALARQSMHSAQARAAAVKSVSMRRLESGPTKARVATGRIVLELRVKMVDARGKEVWRTVTTSARGGASAAVYRDAALAAAQRYAIDQGRGYGGTRGALAVSEVNIHRVIGVE